MSFPKYPAYKDSVVEWIGEIPVGWEVKSLRFALSDIFNGSTATQVEPSNDTMAVTRIETISGGKINLEKVGYINKAESEERKILKNGDIIFSNINSLKMIGNCAIFYGDFLLHSGMNLITLRPNSSVYPKFILYVLKSTLCREEIESRAKPAINQASISQQSICDIKIPDIPLPEQQAIASFLDRECGKIDALIAEQERLIALLAEKRQAVISHAVTKGLNPNAPMKDSGIPWIGMVPEGWMITKIKRICALITGITPPSNDVENYSENGFPWINPADLQEIERPSVAHKYLSQKGEEYIRILPEKSILVCCIGTIGKFGYIDSPASTNQQITSLIAEEMIYPQFLLYLVDALREAMENAATGNVLKILNSERLGNINVSIPSFDAQKKISFFIQKKCQKISSLRNEVEVSITLLKERRASLISAAVTGKIDVRAQSKTIAA